MRIKPAPGRGVRLHHVGFPYPLLPEGGMNVPDSRYYRKQVARGNAVLCADEPKTAPKKSAKKEG